MTQRSRSTHARGSPPPWIEGHRERISALSGDESRLGRVFARSLLPMFLVDDKRRYSDANAPAGLAFRLSLAELQTLRIDDLTPPELYPVMESQWEQLIETGCATGPYRVASPAASPFDVTYCAMAQTLPGLHLISFAPAGWPERELSNDLAQLCDQPSSPLTPREAQVLELAAEGRNGPQIAAELVVSTATVRTHFENIYSKLGVTDRASAVATGLRLGLIG